VAFLESDMEHCRIACVKYLNTLPLIEGLEKLDGVELIPVAPSGIADMVRAGAADVGLVSLVDAVSGGAGGVGKDLALLPVGMIGCDGPTLTVRVFSSVPLERVTELHADTESHTSVVLCRVVMERLFGARPRVVGFEAGARAAVGGARVLEEMHAGPVSEGGGGDTPRSGVVPGEWPAAVLLIGDKVVADAPPAERYPHQLDLGEAWKRMTGLPFVYAVWACRADRAGDAGVRTAAAVLDRQRRHNRTRLDWIAGKHAAAHGWPVELAREYLVERLRFEVGDREREAVGRFVEEAAGFLKGGGEVEWVGSEMANGKWQIADSK